jgi:hypothetical protein
MKNYAWFAATAAIALIVANSAAADDNKRAPAASATAAPAQVVDAAKASDVFKAYERETGKPIVDKGQDKPAPIKLDDGGKSSGPIKLGEDDVSGSRPAAALEPQVETLKQRIADLEAKLNATNGELAKLKAQMNGDLQTLRGQFASHTHNYSAGIDYEMIAIHGHPAWDVPTKLVPRIIRAQSFSWSWETAPPKY